MRTLIEAKIITIQPRIANVHLKNKSYSTTNIKIYQMYATLHTKKGSRIRTLHNITNMKLLEEECQENANNKNNINIIYSIRGLDESLGDCSKLYS